MRSFSSSISQFQIPNQCASQSWRTDCASVTSAPVDVVAAWSIAIVCTRKRVPAPEPLWGDKIDRKRSRIDAVEITERATQPVSWCISWAHDVRLRRRRAEKNEAGALISPAEALRQT